MTRGVWDFPSRKSEHGNRGFSPSKYPQAVLPCPRCLTEGSIRLGCLAALGKSNKRRRNTLKREAPEIPRTPNLRYNGAPTELPRTRAGPGRFSSVDLRQAPFKFRQLPMSKKATPPATGVPFRSKLAPFEAHIRQWMKAGLTYREMAERLRREHSLKAHPDTINSFVLVRSRGRRRAVLPPPVAEAAIEAPPEPAGRARPKGKGSGKNSTGGGPPSHYRPAKVEDL